MIKAINGGIYLEMLGLAIRNLEKHRRMLNDLNVFPVPDGDTGTNMLMTLKNGYGAVKDTGAPLSEIAKSFAGGVVFGARGNSGVIISQFFKGISQIFASIDEANAEDFCTALESGVKHSYLAVANPVDGTMLTVMRDATAALRESLCGIESIDEAVNVFVYNAKISLENTPELLPILKKSGVVDSGGAGLVCIFEGFKAFLDGESIEAEDESESTPSQTVDYSAFDRHSSFEYGYCTELLLLLTDGSEELECERFTEYLQNVGDSLVLSFDEDKIKIHVHTRTPEKVMKYCHRFGEFLHIKIENMSVQHTQNSKKFLCRRVDGECDFAIVAVAPDGLLQKMFSEMGADVCMLSASNPSSSEFIEAFEHTEAKKILVFPNSSNSILSAMQAASLYTGADVTVLNSRTVAECYASLAIIDFESTNMREIVEAVNETLRNIYTVSVVRASKNVTFGNKTIIKNDFFAISGDEIICAGNSLENVSLTAILDTARERDSSVVTVFYGKNVSKRQADDISEAAEEKLFGVELYTIPTEDTVHDLILSFE